MGKSGNEKISKRLKNSQINEKLSTTLKVFVCHIFHPFSLAKLTKLPDNMQRQLSQTLC